MASEKKIDQLQKKCKQNGIALNKLFREASVPTHTIDNWKRKEPDAFALLDRLNKTLDKLIEKKQNE